MLEEPALLYGILVVSGVAAGFLNVMAGGGSMLTLPALMLLGLPAQLANGTNRLAVVSQSVSAVFLFDREGKLERRSILPVLGPTILGALCGAGAAALTPPALLKPILLGTMLVVAVFMLVRPEAVDIEEGKQLTLRERPLGALGLFVAGVYGGFAQAGVGFVLIAVLGGILQYDIHRTNALKLVCTTMYGVAGLAIFIVADQIVWAPAAVLAVATLIGSQLGVRFAMKAPKKIIRWILFGMIVATCVAAFLKGG